MTEQKKIVIRIKGLQDPPTSIFVGLTMKALRERNFVCDVGELPVPERYEVSILAEARTMLREASSQLAKESDVGLYVHVLARSAFYTTGSKKNPDEMDYVNLVLTASFLVGSSVDFRMACDGSIKSPPEVILALKNTMWDIKSEFPTPKPSSEQDASLTETVHNIVTNAILGIREEDVAPTSGRLM